MCIYIYSLNYIQIYSMSNRPCQHQKSLQLDVLSLNDGIAQVLAWLIPTSHDKYGFTWSFNSHVDTGFSRGPQHRPRSGGNGFAGTMPWLFGCWDDNWSSSRAAAADQVGAPSTWQRCSKGSIIPCTGRTRDHMVGLLCYQGQYRNAQAECGQGDKEEAQPLK